MRFLAALLALTFAASAQSPRIISSDLGGKELSFLSKANEHGLEVIYLSELAKTKGGSEAVRALADLLATTQTKEQEQLIALARAKRIALASDQPGAVKRLHALLNPLENGAFDKAWLGEVSAILRAAVQNFTTGAGSSDKEIKAFADSGLALANQKLGVVQKVAKP